MLNVAQLEETVINTNKLYACAPINSGLEQEQEIIQLRQRITELEGEIERIHKELVQERHHANIDLLTGIPNRRAYQIRLQQERLRCMRDGKPLCLAIWDIDHFKSINDGFGHQVGDRVLQCVARKITSRLRRSDFTARFGGEEFVSLLSDCDITNALHLAEELRKEIFHCDQVTEQGSVEVTISCGIAELDPNESDDVLFARADAALYRAKSEGRNRACLAERNTI